MNGIAISITETTKCKFCCVCSERCCSHMRQFGLKKEEDRRHGGEVFYHFEFVCNVKRFLCEDGISKSTISKPLYN